MLWAIYTHTRLAVTFQHVVGVVVVGMQKMGLLLQQKKERKKVLKLFRLHDGKQGLIC